MKYQHRYDWIFNLGGFLWWLFVRFGRTDLEKEQTHKHDFRNFLVVAVLVFVLTFVSVKLTTKSL
ncbi:MAG: hypothetical protein WCY89_04470 [Flavobacteriaceae bacterium]